MVEAIGQEGNRQDPEPNDLTGCLGGAIAGRGKTRCSELRGNGDA
jgi:hypothetical protein